MLSFTVLVSWKTTSHLNDSNLVIQIFQGRGITILLKENNSVYIIIIIITIVQKTLKMLFYFGTHISNNRLFNFLDPYWSL